MKRVPFDLEEKETKDIDNEVIISFCFPILKHEYIDKCDENFEPSQHSEVL